MEVLKIKDHKEKVIDAHKAEFLEILLKLQDPVIQRNRMRYNFLYERGKYLVDRIDTLTEGLAFVMCRKK